MFCKQVNVILHKKDESVNLRPLGDIHLGNLGCDVEKFKKSIAKIANEPNYYTIGMGDYIDNITAYQNGMVDKRWNPETVDREHMTTEEQTDYFRELWRPIAHKTWGLLAGNHEWKTISQERFINDFCKPMGLDYLGRMAYIYVNFLYRKEIVRSYLIHVHHGGYNGLQAGGAVNRLSQIGSDFDADLVLMGHNHDTIVWTGVRTGYNPDTNKLYERKVVYANTGTFLTGYKEGIDSYVEINPRRAKRTGTVTITFEPYSGGIYGHD